ncbi:MAG: triple tyrosine motif-containing protein, partial [Bacteroidota bacterium]
QALFYNEYTIQDGGLWIDDNFRLIEGTKGQVWSLDKINDILFCGHNNGAYIVDDGSARQISSKQGGWRFLPIPGNPNYIIQGTYTGMARLKKENETWDFDKDIKGFNESSRIQTWDDYGNLWITHGYKGVYRLRLNDQLDSVIQVNLYDSTNGLPSRLGNSVFKMDGQIYASTDEGIYRFVFFADKFEKDSSFLSKLNDVQVSDFKKDRYGNLWYFSDYSRNIGLIKGEGSPACFDDVEVLHKLENRYVPAFEHINVYDSANVIIGTVNGFVHFDPTFQAKDSAHFEALVRKVSFYCKNDTTIYYNLDDDLHENIKDVNLNSLISVKVDFSATFYENLEHNTFSYILEGFDEYWSAWTDRTTKEYTNLSAGDYIFRLKAKNVYGRETGINEFEFTVLPPWYQTTWAYIVYFLILAGSVYALIFYLRKKIQRERQEMKEKQKEELKKQKEKYELERLKIIKLQNEKLQFDVSRQRSQVELKNKELASQALNINRKNEILNYIKKELEKVNKRVKPDAQFQLKLLKRKVEDDLNLEDDWKLFKQYFDEVQGDFIKRIKEQYPNLSPSDLKLCAYLRMNLSTKEIAPFLGITPRGVEIHRYRLRKKLGLSRDVNLVEFLLNI